MSHIQLPEAFIRARQRLLGNEWDAFLESYQHPRTYGLRRNPQKDCGQLPFHLEPVPWAPEGYYADPQEHPGRHPLHEAGAYYIQEPSAMAVVSLLDPLPGEKICDLCAAPGGKSTQIAGRLQGQGLLVSNEIIPPRAKILSQNIERMGISNALVCNETPDRMASFFPAYFDRIVVDAPCSGEGMFRKEEAAVAEWSPEQVALCAKRQQDILEAADIMLQPGGIMVYSTCTFAPEENEEIIAWFLTRHPDYVVEDWKDTRIGEYVSELPDHAGLCDGIPDYLDQKDLPEPLTSALTGTLRLWPHKVRGEGHFIARLRKSDQPMDLSEGTSHPKNNESNRLVEEKNFQEKKKNRKPKQSGKKNVMGDSFREAIQQYQRFQRDFLTEDAFANGNVCQLFGEELYCLPPMTPSLNGLKVLRAGLHLGSLRKNRLEPAYALAKAISPSQSRQHHPCTYDEAVRYLKGETLSCDTTQKGWILVSYQGCALGWGKATNGTIKNHYPKGLRWF